MKKTKNKWKTDNCGRCSESHVNYTGKIDSKGVEYVVCGITHKQMNVRFEDDVIKLYSTIWVKI